MEYLLKASAVIALFYLCFYIFLKKETFFQYNRWFLLIGLIIALVFPFIVIPVYITIEPIVISEAANTHTITSNYVTTQPETAFDWHQLFPIIYSIGFLVFLIQFILQFGSLVLLLLKNPKYKDELFTYVIVKNKISPFSFFKWIVYNPGTFEDNELDLILTHEKVHAKQLHSIDLLLTQLACVIFWFNPLIWLYRKQVRQNLEYIADFKTQASSRDEKEYQHLLLKTSVANHNISLSNNFYNSLIKERIIMLKKSRSNKKKQWRYLLMLPLLAGLIMSMNTETIYVETEAEAISNKNTIEFVVAKNTTDKELKSMSDIIKQKGGTLNFSQIKRNNANELTSIFVKLNNHSYGGGNSKYPIDSFIIYKELFGKGGGYVGRIGAATSHFDNNDANYDDKSIEELEKKAIKAILKAGIQNDEDYKSFQQKRAQYKNQKSNKKAAPSISEKTTSVTKPNKNNKNIAMAMPVKIEEEPRLVGDISITIITKNTTDSELEDIKNNLKKEGLTAKFKGVKRNKKGEITAIKIDVKSKKSNASYNVNSNEAIDTVKIVYDENKNSISIGNGHARHGENTFVYATKAGNHKIHKSSSESNVFVISEEEHEHEEGEEHEYEPRVIIKQNRKKGKVRKVKRTKNVEVISGDGDEVIEIIIDDGEKDIEDETIIVNGKKVKVVEGHKNIVVKGKANGRTVYKVRDSNDNKEDIIILQNAYNKGNIFISNDSDKSPLFIIDGKEVSKDVFIELKSDVIESVSVLKDKSAVAKYGKKGKDGVVIIKTKKKN